MYYWPEFIEEINAALPEGAAVLDAGAGDGHWQENLKTGIRYISMDLGVGDASVDYSHLTFKGDLKSIPLEDNSIDAVICIQVLEHLPEPWKVIGEFYRVLKKGGYLFASCPQSEPQHQVPYDFFRFTVYGLRSLFESHGFSIEFIKPQRGNFTKISNDLRHSGNLVLTKGGLGNLIRGFLLKILARFIERFFSSIDGAYATNTTGHFVKARKN